MLRRSAALASCRNFSCARARERSRTPGVLLNGNSSVNFVAAKAVLRIRGAAFAVDPFPAAGACTELPRGAAWTWWSRSISAARSPWALAVDAGRGAGAYPPEQKRLLLRKGAVGLGLGQRPCHVSSASPRPGPLRSASRLDHACVRPRVPMGHAPTTAMERKKAMAHWRELRRFR